MCCSKQSLSPCPLTTGGSPQLIYLVCFFLDKDKTQRKQNLVWELPQKPAESFAPAPSQPLPLAPVCAFASRCMLLPWVLQPNVWSCRVGRGRYSRIFTQGTLMIQRSWLGNGLNSLCSQREMLPWRAIQVTLVRFLLWITLWRSPSIFINYTGYLGSLSC